MSVFEGLDQKKRYRLSSRISGVPLFDFFVRSTAPLEIKILSGNDEGKRLLIDKMSPFIPSRFEVVETGEAPSIGSLKTAGYRTETAAERIDLMIRQREESERLKAMGSANESEGLVPGPEIKNNADISNSVFWGVSAYPRSLRKTILAAIFKVFFRSKAQNIKAINQVSFVENFDKNKSKLFVYLAQRGLSGDLIDFSAPWTDPKNYDKAADRFRSASDEFISGARSAAAPPAENELSAGSSIENITYGGGRRRRTNGRRRNRLRKTHRRR